MRGRFALVAVCLALSVAACGGDDDDSADGGSADAAPLTAEECVDELIDLLDDLTVEEISSPDFEDDERAQALEERCAVMDELSDAESNELFSRLLTEIDPAKLEALGASAETTFEETGDSIN